MDIEGEAVMAEINLLQTSQISSSLSKTEQTPVALREASTSKAEKLTSTEESLPAGENVDSSQKAASQVGSEELSSMMDTLNAQLEKLNNYLRFEKDEDTEKMVVMIKDSETNEIIRQIPSEEFLAVSKNISAYLEARKQLPDGGFPLGLITNNKV